MESPAAELSEEERRARGKAVHRKVMLILGVLTTFAGLGAAYIAFSGSGELPSLFYGRLARPASPAAARPRGKGVVSWGALGPEAYAAAKAQDRLILLDLSCTWGAPCRLMEETTYSDETVARYVRERLVAARVDAQARPDLAPSYYGKPWPATALLLPTGEKLAVAGYMDPQKFLAWARTAEAKRRAVGK